MQTTRLAIERFLASARQPVLSEPGEEWIALGAGNLALEERDGIVLLQAWDDRRNLARRVTGIESSTRAQLSLRVERFGKRTGTLVLLDLQRTDAQIAGRKSARQEFREVFRRFLRREFPDFRIAELSTEPDLEHSLSPAYPRALLERGSGAVAAIAAGPDSNVDGVLSFGLIWLDFLRRRTRGRTVAGLVLFLPAGRETTTCLRLGFLDLERAHYRVFVYAGDGRALPVDLPDRGNLDTRLDLCRQAPELSAHPLAQRISQAAGVETIDEGDGSIAFRVFGCEFARLFPERLEWGLVTKRTAHASNGCELEALARELVRVRSPDAEDRHHALFHRNPEAWLESRVRAQLDVIDATLQPAPVYGQVPAFAGVDRGVLDLLAVDRRWRLAVIELKASQDIHLPLQGLDYWMRVKWHLDRGAFSRQGYFPGIEIRRDAPRLLLVAPALDFHPANERILRFFSPEVPVERLGVGAGWRKRLELMYRM